MAVIGAAPKRSVKDLPQDLFAHLTLLQVDQIETT